MTHLTTRLRHRLAQIIHKAPYLIVIPHFFYRLLQARYTVGVVGVVFNTKGEVLLAKHVFHRHPWGLPGGWVGRVESPEEAIKREFQEELELAIEPLWIVLTSVEAPNHLNIAYLCAYSGEVGALSNELLDYHWYNTANLPRIYPFHHQAIIQAEATIQRLKPCL